MTYKTPPKPQPVLPQRVRALCVQGVTWEDILDLVKLGCYDELALVCTESSCHAWALQICLQLGDTNGFRALAQQIRQCSVRDVQCLGILALLRDNKEALALIGDTVSPGVLRQVLPAWKAFT